MPTASCWARTFWFAPVVSEGARGVTCYLPNTAYGWIDFATGGHLPGGQTVEVEAPLNRLPLFVRAGTVLPLAREWPDEAPHDARAITMSAFAGRGVGNSDGRFFFDDGIGWGYKDGEASLVEHALQWTSNAVTLSLRRDRRRSFPAGHRNPSDRTCRQGGQNRFRLRIRNTR